MTTASFTCAQARAWLPDYVAGRLGLTELALIEMHLGRCATCRQASQDLAAQADPLPPRIRHRRWPLRRLIVPVTSTVTRALTGIAPSRPPSLKSLRTGISAIQTRTSALRGTSSVVRAYAPTVPGWLSSLRWPHWRPSLHSAMESLVRIGTVLVAIAMIGGVWWLPGRDGSRAMVPGPSAPASAPGPPVTPQVTTVEPSPAPEIAIPAPVARPRPRSSPPTQSADRQRAPTPPPESAVPAPEWIPAGGARAPTQGDRVQPTPTSPDADAAVDWLLRRDGRGAGSRGRAETP